MTAVLPDVTTIEHLDFDHEQPCDVPQCRSQHEQPVRWRVTNCCGCVGLICDVCKQGLENAIAARGDQVHHTRCLFCRVQVTACLRDLYIRIEPLP